MKTLPRYLNELGLSSGQLHFGMTEAMLNCPDYRVNHAHIQQSITPTIRHLYNLPSVHCLLLE